MKKSTMRRAGWVVAAFMMSALGTAASADPLRFTYTGGSGSYLFDLASDPTPDGYDSLNGFYLLNVPVEYNGTATFQNLQFNTGDNYGGFATFIPPDTLTGGAYGAALFSGTPDAPHFSPGSTVLSDGAGGPGLFTISALPSAPGAPGPEVGFGIPAALAALGALFLTRRRRAIA